MSSTAGFADAPVLAKASRILRYYARLIRYAAGAEPKVFHILWNNKFELFDRTVLLLYYKLIGKRLVFTAHNVNARKRDEDDSRLNRITLKAQYRLLDHIFVHTRRMKRELCDEFNVSESKVSVIPFGINNTVPNSRLTSTEAKQQLQINKGDKTLLFFGNIAPYKGLEYLVTAFIDLVKSDQRYRLLIVGNPKGEKSYWNRIHRTIVSSGVGDRVTEKIEYVPDEATELYFKAADVLVLPYTHVFQSGVLFLGYSFGLPAIAADVGSMSEEVTEGENGFVFTACDSSDLAHTIEDYFDSELFCNLKDYRAKIKNYANEQYSWSKVVAITKAVYSL